MISDERLQAIADGEEFRIGTITDMAQELLALRKAADQYRIQGVQIVIEKNQQARERLSALANFEDYEPYLDGLDDGCRQVIKEIEEGTLPDKFKKSVVPQ